MTGGLAASLLPLVRAAELLDLLVLLAHRVEGLLVAALTRNQANS